MDESPANPSSKKYKSAVKWAFVMNWGPNLIATLLTFVLAGVLGPHDYGVVSVAVLYVAFVQIFLEGGLGAAIVQRQKLDPEHLDAVFWITCAFSLGLMVLTWLTSPFIARFFNGNPADILLTQKVLNYEALLLPLQGLTVVQESLLEKTLEFKSLAVRANVSTLLGGIVGVVMAFTGFGVWALVGDDIISGIVRTALLWRLGDWRPALRFSYRHVKELFGFSFFVMLAQIGTFVQRRSDAILIGHFFGPTAVGIYRLADRLINIIIDMATRPLIIVVLPHFAAMQNNLVELRKAVVSCLKTASMVTLPMLAILGGTAFLICNALSSRGKNWDQADHVIQVLAIVGAARAVTLLVGPLMQSVNRPRQFMWMSWFLAGTNTISFCVAGYFLARHPNVETQAVGIAAVRAIVFCVVYTPICFWIVSSICGMPIRSILKILMPSLLVSAAVMAIGIGVTHGLEFVTVGRHFPVTASIVKLVQMCLGGAITTGVALLLMITFEPTVGDVIRKKFGKRGGRRPSVVPVNIANEVLEEPVAEMTTAIDGDASPDRDSAVVQTSAS